MKEEFKKIEKKFGSKFWLKLDKENPEAFCSAASIAYYAGRISHGANVSLPEIIPTDEIEDLIYEEVESVYSDWPAMANLAFMISEVPDYWNGILKYVKEGVLPKEIIEVARLKLEADIKDEVHVYKKYFGGKLDIKKLLDD